ncbi:MACPF domain-containing protein CAD1 [Cajanus cajan]|uniref:MACPF domain-containing protein CAD1 n=1 Tax=Cajanus cajan TaxID=3821 RepID=UPI00098D8737|nr:MACPF domain-containing protein CAD1 [Cajanus cajan]
MGEHVAALHTATNAVEALGRGFDVNCDTRLLYCKGVAGSRVIHFDEEHVRELWLYDDVVVPNVSRDIVKDSQSQEPVGRYSSGVFSFHEMVEYFNQKANITESFPLGTFNSAFSFTASKHIDASETKSLSSDGFYVPLAKVRLVNSHLMLQENVKRAIPVKWDPPSLASFIENFGTHVITSVTIGGKDVIYVKQHHTSPLSTLEIKNYIQDIGNQRFSDINNHACSPETKSKDKDVRVIFRRRGGDDLEQNHIMWVRTVWSSPDVIEMTFCPITDILDEVPGREHLTRAIGLYLEYKPPIEELRYFLEFQITRVWAPFQDRIPGYQRKEPLCPYLLFSIMGQKLYVSQEQITVGRKPTTGLRLYLDGSKQNRLSVHVQHLTSLPKILKPYWDTDVAIGAPKWQGPEEQDSRWFEPVKWKNFSHVCTAPIENPETFTEDFSGVSAVTGAQLGVWDFGSRNVLYMKLLFSRLPGCTIRRSIWDHTPNSDSSRLGSKKNVSENKLFKYVDLSEMCKGPQDPPGHWLVTGGKLGVEKGKIVLRVKYSLLNY